MERNPQMQDKLLKDFYIQSKIDGKWAMPDFHYHEGFEIYYILSGEASIFVENRIYQVKSGDLLAFNHLDFHRIDASKCAEFERCVIMFNPDYIEAFSTLEEDLLECFLKRSENYSPVVRLSPEQHEQFTALIARAKANEEDHSFGSQVYKKIILAEMLILVNRLFRAASDQNFFDCTYHDKKVENLTQYILLHLPEDLSLEHLSDRFFISKCHLQNIFKRATGFNIHEYILNKRILKARELLRKDHTVIEVCERVGFNNYSNFIRAFRKHVGISPKQYSKNCR